MHGVCRWDEEPNWPVHADRPTDGFMVREAKYSDSGAAALRYGSSGLMDPGGKGHSCRAG